MICTLPVCSGAFPHPANVHLYRVWLQQKSGKLGSLANGLIFWVEKWKGCKVGYIEVWVQFWYVFLWKTGVGRVML